MLGLRDAELLKQRCLVDGAWIDADDGAVIPVINPANGEVIANVPRCGQVETLRAIDAAERALPEWAARSAKERAVLLHAWQGEILAHIDDLALILSYEQGKPLEESRGEIAFNAAYLEWFAEEAKRAYGDVIPAPQKDRRLLVLKQPVGVCAAITPWNFPNGMITRKAGPALAAGCPQILKPASKTPLSALALGELALRAGIPAGVFNVLTGSAEAIGRTLCQSPTVRKITFTGSTEVGIWLMREAAGTVKKLSLELGGNAPFIVFEDADLDTAVDGAMIAKYRNSGQTCVSANRIYVHEKVAAAFTQKLAERARTLRVGPCTEPGAVQGPLIDEAAVAKVEEHIADALKLGANLVTGGARHALGGTYFEPTVLGHCTQQMLVAREETFAPLAPVFSFGDENEVIRMANATEFGLAGYFYTRDLGRAWRVAERLEVGVVGVNTGLVANETAPFGGVKYSGVGREGSRYGLDDYLELKYVCMAGI